MWKINRDKLDLFKPYSQGYLYPLDRGAFITFKKSGVYDGVKLMFLGNISFYEHKADELLQSLYKRNLIDYVEIED